jgi:hypothetical protein
MKITLLGTGTPAPSLARQSAGYLTLVLTHLLAQIDRPELRERIVHEIQREFTGQVVWGEDLMRLTLSSTGVASIEGQGLV